jgi:hypothetical protein
VRLRLDPGFCIAPDRQTVKAAFKAAFASIR